jgi:hypothetical protein
MISVLSRVDDKMIVAMEKLGIACFNLESGLSEEGFLGHMNNLLLNNCGYEFLMYRIAYSINNFGGIIYNMPKSLTEYPHAVIDVPKLSYVHEYIEFLSANLDKRFIGIEKKDMADSIVMVYGTSDANEVFIEIIKEMAKKALVSIVSPDYGELSTVWCQQEVCDLFGVDIEWLRAIVIEEMQKFGDPLQIVTKNIGRVIIMCDDLQMLEGGNYPILFADDDIEENLRQLNNIFFTDKFSMYHPSQQA